MFVVKNYFDNSSSKYCCFVSQTLSIFTLILLNKHIAVTPILYFFVISVYLICISL